MANIEGNPNPWTLTASQAGTYNFATGGNYVDRDIELVVPEGSVSASGSGTGVKPTIASATGGNVTSTPTTTKPGSGYYIAVAGKKEKETVTLTKGTITPGWVDDISLSDVEIAATTGSTYYLPISGATVTKGTTTVNASTKAVTRGTFDITAGYIDATAGDLAAATFANSATSGVTYVDISDTNAAPVLISEDYLYINQGYVDNLKISLKKLSPDGASGADAIKAGMLDSVSAYDNDGKLVTGNIATISLPTSAAASASGTNMATISRSTSAQYINIPAGYNATAGSYKINAVPNAGAATVSPKDTTTEVTVSAAATDGFFSLTNTVSAGSKHASAGYVGTTEETGSASIQVGKIAAGTITNNTTLPSGKTSSGTINAGKYIKITKGYIAEDKYYRAQTAATQQAITGTLTSAIDDGFVAPTLVDSKTAGTSYVSFTGNGTMTTGNAYNGTANGKTQYLKVYSGSYTIS